MTWLWFTMDNDPGRMETITGEPATLSIGNRIVLERRFGSDSLETVTIKGDDAGLEEALLALKKGSLVTELNLVYRYGEMTWRFNLKGESFHITQFQLPETGPVDSQDDADAAVLDRSSLFEQPMKYIDALFKHFIRHRVTKSWSEDTVPHIKNWINR